MSVQAVLLGGSGASEGLRDVLVDYSAAGLLEDFIWVPLTSVGPDTRCLVVSAGTVTTARLVDVVADGLGQEVRFAAITALTTGSRSPGSAEINTVERLLPLGAGRRYRVLLTGSEGVDGDVRDAVLGGWHNVLLAPEDSDAPGAGQVLLGRSRPPPRSGACSRPGSRHSWACGWVRTGLPSTTSSRRRVRRCASSVRSRDSWTVPTSSDSSRWPSCPRRGASTPR
ncbi:hypothetical protein C8046_11670 [Serinibacter arcticus]|uniref:Uncharacterized protein n=1 Tax=Serinibacter arcticus TaxID=1655435 RepID=A0A2U1ZW64_9MICO|nr:hypothetical protein C8046_11670 [Serinibacter arcticus]